MACLASDVLEPHSMSKASISPQSKQWRNVGNEEYKALMDNNTWSLAHLPENEKAISNKSVFKVKWKPDGTVDHHTPRLVVQGYTQKSGIDNEKNIFSCRP